MKNKQSDVITDIKKFFEPKVYPYWVTASDDQMNKVLKTAIYCLYAYGFYVIVKELVEKFI